MRRRPLAVQLTLVGVVALAVALVMALAATGVITSRRTPDGAAGPTAGTPTPTAVTQTTRQALTVAQAGRAFLDGYVDPDGRVVRRDQGNDTVSEGQAYAMLVSVGLADRSEFDRVWSWTEQNLMRPDGTLSWRWDQGRVVDQESASDADLDAARALILAGQQFGDESLTDAGARLGRGILTADTARTRLGLILTAGSWVDRNPYAYNPSYASPAAYAVMAKATGDDRWTELASGSRAATSAVLAKTDLPPDWAQIHADGTVDPMPGAQGRGNDGVRYSYDAARLPIRYAESCSASDVGTAASLRKPLSTPAGSFAARDLGGRPLIAENSTVAAVAEAASASAAGDFTAGSDALIDADHLQQRSPTYYGAAWDALGRLMLSTDHLGGCGRLES